MNKSIDYKPLGVAIFFITVSLIFYFSIFNKGFSYINGDWGTFGDFFGGVMNPILGFVNLFLLSTTLSLQIKSSNNQTTNTKIQEISAKIVAIGHLLEVTTQQIRHFSDYSHLLKDDEIALLKKLHQNHKTHLTELDEEYNNLKKIKQDSNNGTD